MKMSGFLTCQVGKQPDLQNYKTLGGLPDMGFIHLLYSPAFSDAFFRDKAHYQFVWRYVESWGVNPDAFGSGALSETFRDLDFSAFLYRDVFAGFNRIIKC